MFNPGTDHALAMQYKYKRHQSKQETKCWVQTAFCTYTDLERQYTVVNISAKLDKPIQMREIFSKCPDRGQKGVQGININMQHGEVKGRISKTKQNKTKRLGGSQECSAVLDTKSTQNGLLEVEKSG